MRHSAIYLASTHATWVALLGRLHDADGPSGEYRLTNGRLEAHWPVGCYIGVDADAYVDYVGQVCRATGGFAQRFASHHKPVEEWHRVWILPFRVDVPAQVVSLIEAMLILILRPSANRINPSISFRVGKP